MSFSYDTKCELCTIKLKNDCCKLSQLYGMVLFAQNIGSDSLKITTENVLIVNLLSELAENVAGVYFVIDETVNLYTLEIKGDALKKLYDILYITVNGKIDLLVSGVLTENDCCTDAFLRGAFLIGGYTSNPENSYHFEISTPYYTLAMSMKDFMQRLNFPVRVIVRKSNYVLYIKDSEEIERLLYRIGAKKSAFAFIDMKIQKEMNNYSNRVNNTKLHNIEKTINKSVEQVKAIKKISEKIGLDSLDSDLMLAARLRCENPDKSLNELVLISGNKFSRSGLSRRLNKLTEIALKLGD